MNAIGARDWEFAFDMFYNGASIREVSATVGISKETAHRIQKAVKLALAEEGETIRVNTGKNSRGEMTFYETTQIIPTWLNKPHSGETLYNPPPQEENQ